jgi:NADPH:quinone reductase
MLMVAAWRITHECLFEFGHLKEGQSVLVHAGTGALGLATLQLAKRAGARVFTTLNSAENFASNSVENDTKRWLN